jgi:DUF1009 family protein
VRGGGRPEDAAFDRPAPGGPRGGPARGDAPIGLIAGRGALPLEAIDAVRRQGRRVVCVDVFEGDPRLREAADAYCAVATDDLRGILDALLRYGVREVLLAGKVDKMRALRRALLDAEAAAAAARLPDHRDTTILETLLAALEASGLRVAAQAEYLGHLVPAPGTLTPRAPSAGEMADIDAGVRIARQIAAFDIGQAVAMRRGMVVAVEAAEGTDAMIRRAGALTAGTVVVKVSRPAQDPRYDLPGVGPETVRALTEARATALAIEAGRTLLLGREEAVAEAAAAGIAVVAVRVPPAG